MTVIYLCVQKGNIQFFTTNVDNAMLWKERGFAHVEREVIPVRQMRDDDFVGRE